MKSKLLQLFAATVCCVSLCGCEKDYVVNKHAPLFHINENVYCRRHYGSNFKKGRPSFSISNYDGASYIYAAITRVGPGMIEEKEGISLYFYIPQDSVYEGSILKNEVSLSTTGMLSSHKLPDDFTNRINKNVVEFLSEIDSTRVLFNRFDGFEKGDSLIMTFSFVIKEYCSAKLLGEESKDTTILLGRYVCNDGIFKEAIRTP